jgi:hypothetical protein
MRVYVLFSYVRKIDVLDRKLADILGMSADVRRAPKDAILLNLLCQCFMFANASEFGDEQISTFLSIILNLHRTSMGM